MRTALALLLAATLQNTFDVASIKRNLSGGAAAETVTTPGRLNLINATLYSVVLRAFGVLDAQVANAPGWLMNERYDVVAVTGDDTALTDEKRKAYLQALLEERCALKFHREMRELRVYSLVSSKNGARLPAYSGSGDYSMRIQPADEGRLRLRSTKGNLKRLTEILAGQVGDLVVDRTGLTGEFDFVLEWAPAANPDAIGPTLFTALEEQLGLKLESAKVPTEVIVIDRIDRPSL